MSGDLNMGRYTKSNDPSIDTQIESHLGLVVDRIRSILGDSIHSIILVGGFGRGEGSVRSIGDQGIKILNDYDLFVVPKPMNSMSFAGYYRKWQSQMEEIGGELSKTLNVKQIDISIRPHSYFTSQGALKIENYEVKYGSRLLWGSCNPSECLPNWTQTEIPLFEGAWLLRNRGFCMLLSAWYLLKGLRVDWEKESFYVGSIKGQIAMGDAMLLLQGLYDCSYARRQCNANKVKDSGYNQEEEVLRLYRNALSQKLEPDFDQLESLNPEAWFAKILGEMDPFFLYFEGRRCRKGFDDWISYSHSNRRRWPTLRPLLRSLARGEFNASTLMVRCDPTRSVAVVALLLFSLNRRDQRLDYLRRAAELLGMESTLEDEFMWAKLVQKTVQVIHPTGEGAHIMEGDPVSLPLL